MLGSDVKKILEFFLGVLEINPKLKKKQIYTNPY